MNDLVKAKGKRWGFIATVLASISQRTRLTARRVQEWARLGLVEAYKVGRSWVVSVEGVLAREREARQTVERLGSTPRGTRLARA